MAKRHQVVGAWHTDFHKIVDQARKEYSRQLGKNISMMEVTRIWGSNKFTKFKIPKLRIRRNR